MAIFVVEKSRQLKKIKETIFTELKNRNLSSRRSQCQNKFGQIKYQIFGNNKKKTKRQIFHTVK